MENNLVTAGAPSTSGFMKMDVNRFHTKVVKIARQDIPSDAVPYTFERRVMARLASVAAPAMDPLGSWAHSLWRAAAPCVAITMLLGAWTLFTTDPAGAPDEFAQHFESIVLAGADSEPALLE